MDFTSPRAYWRCSEQEKPQFPVLNAPCHVDVAIIGAGITGLTAALHLKRSGKRVAVFEAGTVGAGTTGASTGHLDVMPDQGLTKLVSAFGKTAARDITAARQSAIDQIERWTHELGIDCDFRRVSGIAYTELHEHNPQIRAEYETAREMGLDATFRSETALPWPTACNVEVPNQGRIDPLRYLCGLARAVHGEESSIYEHTLAAPPRDGMPCRTEANGHAVTASNILVATHSAYLGVSYLDMRQAPYQSYAMAVRVEEELPDTLYWDDARPYHYIRRAWTDDPRLLIIGGADHKTGQGNARDHLQRLKDYVAQRLSVVEIERTWSAEFFKPCDGIPLIGRAPMTRHLYIATGFSGTGLTYGTLAGRMLADLVLEGRASHAEIFSPGRFAPVASAKDFVLDNANVVRRFFADRLGGEPIHSLDEVRRGTGRLIRFEGEQYAAYRDENDELHLMSPNCTHMGCRVQWNHVEQTWDCPCHGGRYTATGERIYGPPSADLARKEAPVAAGV